MTSARRFVLMACGGVAGASVRWLLTSHVHVGGTFPWVVFVVNMVGCAILGAALAEEVRHPHIRALLRDFVGVGFCGGLTTMSTFAVDSVSLWRGDHHVIAVANVAASVCCGIIAAIVAARLCRSVRALMLPVEGGAT
jgi:fluoride exporter